MGNGWNVKIMENGRFNDENIVFGVGDPNAPMNVDGN